MVSAVRESASTSAGKRGWPRPACHQQQSRQTRGWNALSGTTLQKGPAQHVCVPSRTGVGGLNKTGPKAQRRPRTGLKPKWSQAAADSEASKTIPSLCPCSGHVLVIRPFLPSLRHENSFLLSALEESHGGGGGGGAGGSPLLWGTHQLWSNPDFLPQPPTASCCGCTPTQVSW